MPAIQSAEVQTHPSIGHQKLSANKEIYQSILEEIFNQYDGGEAETEREQKMIKGFEYSVPKYPNIRGRYKADYEELEMIGEGGFGSVYRCRNRVDSNIYAVKKIIINYNDPQSRKLLK